VEHTDNLNEEPRSVRQDGSVSLEALGGGNGVAAEPCVCVVWSKSVKYWRHDKA